MTRDGLVPAHTYKSSLKATSILRILGRLKKIPIGIKEVKFLSHIGNFLTFRYPIVFGF